MRMTLEDLFQRMQRGEVEELNLIIKADTKGSAEALRQALERIDQEFQEVDLRIIHEAVGPIVETDVNLAVASGAIIIGFHVGADPVARQLARDQRVQIRTYNIIYEATDDIRKAMVGLLPPIFEEFVLGRAEVREVFRSSRLGAIAGCHVLEGRMVRGADVRVFRGADLLFDGRLTSLRRFQDDVAEVSSGFDCGIIVEGFQAWEAGDVVEAYEKREVAREG
jgi:translation initiation factor IF-2